MFGVLQERLRHIQIWIESSWVLRMVAIATLVVGANGCGVALYTSSAITNAEGDVEVFFADHSPKAQLRQVQKPAIIGTVVEARMAEVLSGSGRFRQVVTPHRVRTILNNQGYPEDLSALTKEEDKRLFQVICNKSPADAIIGFRSAGGQANMPNHFEVFFKRASTDKRFVLSTYSCKRKDIISREAFTYRISIGHVMPDTDTIARYIGEELGKYYVKISS